MGKKVDSVKFQRKVREELSEEYCSSRETFLLKLKEKYGKDFSRIPAAAIGVYNYYERLVTGLQQFMAGERKFKLNLIDRNDIMALTRHASEISGISYVMDSDKEQVDKILGVSGKKKAVRRRR